MYIINNDHLKCQWHNAPTERERMADGIKKKNKEFTRAVYRRLILEQNIQIAREKGISCK